MASGAAPSRGASQPATGASFNAGAAQPGHGDEVDHSSAFAPQQEARRAIRDVLELRHRYLVSKGIEEPRHVLTDEERAEFIRCVRADFEDSEEQRALQDTDAGRPAPSGAAGAIIAGIMS